jgi:sterol desaturase/sphingolipid hydroxylase (fatty acid hydroxylase superfamily)
MEVVTSFYKHPVEILCNSILITTLVYPILGLSIEANEWVSIFSAFSEFFYHMNIKTPHWIGYIIQRPESHCLHHKRDARFCKN